MRAYKKYVLGDRSPELLATLADLEDFFYGNSHKGWGNLFELYTDVNGPGLLTVIEYCVENHTKNPEEKILPMVFSA